MENVETKNTVEVATLPTLKEEEVVCAGWFNTAMYRDEVDCGRKYKVKALGEFNCPYRYFWIISEGHRWITLMQTDRSLRNDLIFKVLHNSLEEQF